MPRLAPRRRARRATTALAAAVALAVLAGVCAGDDDDAGASASGRDPSPSTSPPADGTVATGRSPLEWERCGRAECATLEVPLDHADPGGRRIELRLARRPAGDEAQRVGVLLVNPGGPGAPGLDLAKEASAYFSTDLLDRFDIVAWDPRGVGESTPVECVDDLDPWYALDKTPDDDAERTALAEEAEALAEACGEESGWLLPHLASEATVRDIDLVRDALGEERISYLGYSYGTYLGARYADRFPSRVRAMVLDGAIDPSLTAEASAREQGIGFEAALERFFTWCAENPGRASAGRCEFGGGRPEAAYERLNAMIEAETLPAGDDREVGPGEWDLAIALALYARELWPELGGAMNDAARGDGAGVAALADLYTGRDADGRYDNQTEAFYAIGCLDGQASEWMPGLAPLDAYDALASSVAEAAPRLGASGVWLSLPCAYWPATLPEPDRVPPGAIDAPDAPPILVVGTTGDPATPFRWAEALAAQLARGVLLVNEGDGHTGYFSGNACLDAAIDRYLVDVVAPPDGTRCAP